MPSPVIKEIIDELVREAYHPKDAAQASQAFEARLAALDDATRKTVMNEIETMIVSEVKEDFLTQWTSADVVEIIDILKSFDTDVKKESLRQHQGMARIFCQLSAFKGEEADPLVKAFAQAYAGMPAKDFKSLSKHGKLLLAVHKKNAPPPPV